MSPGLVLMLLLGIGGVMYLGWSPAKFRKSVQCVRSLFSRGFNNALFPSSPDSLNEGERAFLWAKEFDLAIQPALAKLGMDVRSSEAGFSSLPLKRVVEFRQEEIPWVKIRSIVLGLVHKLEGKVFKASSSNGRRMIFRLGGTEAATWSYILIFQKKIPPEASTIVRPEAVRPEAVRPERGPVVALVIDDLGYNRSLARSLFSLNLTLTVSILPNHPFSRVCALEAHDHSLEVILHLPMQPHRYSSNNLEKNTLLVKMSKQEIVNILDSDLQDVPWAKGVNNHMGSLMLEDKRSMQVILKELKKRNLYFLDSRTTRNSIGYDLARNLGIPTACRDVFLDNRQDLSYIKGQLDLLIKTALKEGKAVGIGHLHPKTIQALRETTSKFSEKGITLVTLSEMME